MTNPKLNHQRNWMGWDRENRLVLAMDDKASADQIKAQGQAPWVRNALANNLNALGDNLRVETDTEKRAELETRVEKGKAYLDRLRTYIDSPQRMESALAEWDQLNTLMARLEVPGAKYSALVDILDSDLEVFLDSELRSKAILAREAIVGGSRIGNVIDEPTLESLTSTAEEKWEETKALLRSEAAKLKDPEARSFYEDEIAKNDASHKGEWVRKNIKKFETEKFSVKEFSDKIPSDALGSIGNIVSEAKAIIQERLAERLEKKVDEVQAKAEEYLKKWESELNPNTRKEIEGNLGSARKTVDLKIRSFDSGSLSPSEALVSLSEQVSAFEAQAEKSIRGIEGQDAKLEHLAQNREAVIRNTARKEAKILNLSAKARNRDNGKAMSASVANASQLINPEDTVAAGQLEFDQKALKRLEGDKEPEALSELSALKGEELIARAQEVGDIANKLESTEKAEVAKKAMSAIQSAQNVKEALDRLAESVGPEHVEYVSSKVFEAKYRRYTTEGFMVFAIKGDEWRVIVDGDRVKEGGNANLLNDLKWQLTHELRHLEFEGDASLNESWARAFTERLGKGEWHDIKASFANEFPTKTPSDYVGNRTEFGPDDWTDADVLSELYAMAPDWSFMPDSVAQLANKAVKIAAFGQDVGLRSKWESAFLGGIDREKWLRVREAIEASFPNRADASGARLSQWDDREVLAELYAMPLSQLEAAPELMAALSAAGIFGWLYGKGSKAESYEDSVQERILGSEGHGGGKGGKGKDDKEGGGEALPMSKEGIAKSLKEIIEKIDTYGESPYIGQIAGGTALLAEMKSMAKKTIGKLDELEREGKLPNAQELVTQLEDDLEGEGESVKNEIRTVSEQGKNPEKNPLRAFWNDTHIYSVHAFLSVYEHAKEYFTKWMKRNEGIHKGNLSKQIFEGIHEGLALESSSFISGAWKEAIGAWEEKLKSKDTSKLKKYLKEQAHAGSPDKAVVCAVINVMVEKGVMDWVNEDLWTCLNKMQTETRFGHPQDKLLYSDKNYLREKLKIAFASAPVFNKAVAFNEKDSKNTRAYEDKKGEYKSVIVSATSLIGPRLRKLLLKAKGGGHDEEYDGDKDIDPAEYEELLDLSIENGFFSPESVIFYLLSGMACGLLQPGTGSRLAKHFGAYPIMEYFNAMVPQMSTTGDIRKFVKAKFNKEYLECGHGDKGSEFMRFYWTEVVNHPRVLSRMTQKVEAGGGNWDHDWSKAFAMCGNAAIAKTILKGPSSSPTTKLTQPPNIYAGLLQWFEQNSNEGIHTGKDLLAQRIGYYFAFESILSGAAYAEDKSYRRGSDFASDKTKPPREQGNHPGMSVLAIEGKLNGMMGSISPTLGKLLELAIDKSSVDANPTAHLAKIKTLLGTSAPGIVSSLSNLDDFYNNIGLIVTEVLKSVPADSLVAGIRRGVG